MLKLGVTTEMFIGAIVRELEDRLPPRASSDAYNSSSPPPSHPPTTGAVETDTLGFAGRDSVYHFRFDIADSSPSIVFNFTGSTNQAVNDEGWGLDNVTVTTATAVPEPGLLLFAGCAVPLMAFRLLRKSRC